MKGRLTLKEYEIILESVSQNYWNINWKIIKVVLEKELKV